MENDMNNSATSADEALPNKGNFRLSVQRLGTGGIASLTTAFIFTTIIHLVILRQYWDVFFLMVAGFMAVVSLPIGAVGGLILGSIWKNGKAAIIAGIVIGALVPILSATLFTCPFFGGC